MDDSIDSRFELETEEPKIIKVIGVGGGGGNAVTHMYKKGIHDVSFLLCNTDKQAMKHSEVPNKFVLGEAITHGLGAGAKPEVGCQAAEASEEDIQRLLDDGTEMVFITAGMGGGTGTGAAPVIARIAKQMDILTVGIVTIPFRFEGGRKIYKALMGVEEMSKNVDALLVINNEKLREIYPDLELMDGFAKADDTLAVAAKSIAEIITLPGIINTDFADVKTTLKDGGVALISNGYGEGERRMLNAFEDAMLSPLLNNNDIFTAKKILFNISFSENSKLKLDELESVDNFMANFDPDVIDVIYGTSLDNSLADKIKVTILASGFGVKNVVEEKDRIDAERMKEKIEQYYNMKSNFPGNKSECVIFGAEELDDDHLINLLEDVPAYERKNLKDIREYRNKRAATSVPGKASAAANGPVSEQVISF
ncbi:MAG: cell division protein FtsZ [Tannerella sp.]|jgi:cell division protein FtsZ|nr:cell division protein FtsZ [Tannerella sp.]